MKKLSCFLICIILFFMIVSSAYALEESQFRAQVFRVEGDHVQVEDTFGQRFDIDTSIGVGNGRRIHAGDKVIVNKVEMDDGSLRYFIVDMLRTPWVFGLIILFIVSVIVFGRKHGFRSLITVVVTLLLIVYVVIPLILDGWNPLFATMIGISVALFFSIYFVYGWTKISHASIIAILACMGLAGILSWFFITMLSLSGFVSDEATYLVAIGFVNIDMRGLLLAAVLVGTLGVLDDVVVSQVSVIQELQDNGVSDAKTLYASAMRVGRNHMSSMINTLIFAYTGASFPLMILFTLHQAPFDSISSIVNNEIVATELLRSLIGSIILLASVPLTTVIAIYVYRNK